MKSGENPIQTPERQCGNKAFKMRVQFPKQMVISVLQAPRDCVASIQSHYFIPVACSSVVQPLMCRDLTLCLSVHLMCVCSSTEPRASTKAWWCQEQGDVMDSDGYFFISFLPLSSAFPIGKWLMRPRSTATMPAAVWREQTANPGAVCPAGRSSCSFADSVCVSPGLSRSRLCA